MYLFLSLSVYNGYLELRGRPLMAGGLRKICCRRRLARATAAAPTHIYINKCINICKYIYICIYIYIHISISISISIYIYRSRYIGVSVCVCVWAGRRQSPRKKDRYRYIDIDMCVCVCVCVWERELDGARVLARCR